MIGKCNDPIIVGMYEIKPYTKKFMNIPGDQPEPSKCRVPLLINYQS